MQTICLIGIRPCLKYFVNLITVVYHDTHPLDQTKISFQNSTRMASKYYCAVAGNQGPSS